MNSLTRFFVPSVAIAGLLALAGCGGGGGGTSPSPSGTGVQIRLTDAPGNFQHVYVTISGVSVVDGSGGIQTVNSQAQTLDLLALQNVDRVIGTANLPAGSYSQIRLKVTSAQVVDSTGKTSPLTVPSGAQSGLKLVDDFTITPNQITSILLDFNAAQSVVTTGNSHAANGVRYLLKPVIKVVAQVVSGQISGKVLDANGQPIPATSNPLVTAYPAGAPTDGSVPVAATAIPSATDGSYTLDRLPAGSYDLYVTADGYASQTVPNVTVTANATTTENTVSLAPAP